MIFTNEFDTIAAIATPVGTGGIGVIRISGSKSFDIIKKLYKKELIAGKIYYGKISYNDKPLDEAVILPFKAPNSYTGEDVIEIQCHGGINVLRNVLDAVLASGARMAERGEYTKRAFLNHKMDLSKAEAVCDLIHAKTKTFALQSVKNLSGLLETEIKEIRKIIFELLSRIVAGIDFPDEVEEPEYSYIEDEITKAINKIDSILACANSSNVLRQGIKVAILGKPNVGKSSLFNALLRQTRAIVTDIAGTTRDILTETLDFNGVPVTLIDTAGIRENNTDEDVGKVERIGIDFSKQSAQEADFILFLYDITQGIKEEDKDILELIKDKKVIKIANKNDINKDSKDSKDTDAIRLSTLTGEGLEELKNGICKLISEKSLEDTEFITNNRQQDCLEKCKQSLEQALLATHIKELQDLISIDIKSSLLYLDEITGEVITDDILNNIFDKFCVGK